MMTTEEILTVLRNYKACAADKYGIEHLALFGSAARGEQDDMSDIDICVRLREASFKAYMDIKEDLEAILCVKVDLVTLHENMRELFRRNIERDAIYI